MEKSKGKKIAIIVIVAIFAAAVVGVSVWQITVDVMAKNIGLVKVNDLSYDAPLDVVAEEGDVQLQDVRMHYAKCGSGYPLLLVQRQRKQSQGPCGPYAPPCKSLYGVRARQQIAG